MITHRGLHSGQTKPKRIRGRRAIDLHGELRKYNTTTCEYGLGRPVCDAREDSDCWVASGSACSRRQYTLDKEKMGSLENENHIEA
jgi:hypothetical protein